MNPAICGHPANRLLPFYLNGSLDGAEQESVRDHVDRCERCTHEIGALSEVAAVVRQRKLPILDAEAGEARAAADWLAPAAGWRAPARRMAVAVAILLPILTGILAYRAGASRGAAHRSAANEAAADAAPSTTAPAPVRLAAAIDLGSGPARGTSTLPRLTLASSVELVSIRFVAPVAPDIDHALELHGPSGALILSRRIELVLDPLGSATCVLPRDLFRTSGPYTLGLREEPQTGEGRLFEYHFMVERAEDAPARP